MISKDVIGSPVNSGDLLGFFLPHSYRSKSPTRALLACGGGGRDPPHCPSGSPISDALALWSLLP